VVGIGGNLIRKELIEAGDYAAISTRVSQVLGWIREARKK
jgi:2-keto-3-deoxy-6-phosphogluconate aldolase